jgi:hypothetical protein
MGKTRAVEFVLTELPTLGKKFLMTGVADPCHFGADPDPRIRTSD